MLSSYKDEDFYCSFTEFPNTTDGLQLSYTIHPKFPIEQMRSPIRRIKSYGNHSRSSGIRTSFDSKRSNANSVSSSTSTKSRSSSLRSFFSSSTGSSTSTQRRKLLTKMKQPFGAMIPPAKNIKRKGGMLLLRHKKPSTLDFRCIGEACGDMSRVSSLNMSTFSSPMSSPTSARFSILMYDDAPKIPWERPQINDDWNSNWFAGIC